MSDAWNYHLEPLTPKPGARARQAELLRTVFPHAAQYTEEFLTWEYDENPSGTVVGFDAVEGDSLCAHYAAQPLEARLFGSACRGLLSFNTATHPAHQGRGLFTKLARETYRVAAEQGFEFVIGVANANSTPGFTAKLGFQLVSSLEVRLGIGQPANRGASDADFVRVWDDVSRKWRCKNPSASYGSSHGFLIADAHLPMIGVSLSSMPWDEDAAARPRLFRPLRLWMGLPLGEGWRGLALPIPHALRPSPLNLIFLDLTGKGRTLDPRRVVFNPVDFDAY